MYFIIIIGLTILFTAVFFGIPYAISAKFGNNYYDEWFKTKSILDKNIISSLDQFIEERWGNGEE